LPLLPHTFFIGTLLKFVPVLSALFTDGHNNPVYGVVLTGQKYPVELLSVLMLISVYQHLIPIGNVLQLMLVCFDSGLHG
jgi:hypothetical protein